MHLFIYLFIYQVCVKILLCQLLFQLLGKQQRLSLIDYMDSKLAHFSVHKYIQNYHLLTSSTWLKNIIDLSYCEIFTSERSVFLTGMINFILKTLVELS